jgi:amino acid transporter
LRSPRELIVLLAFAGVVDVAVLTENPLLLYPLALLSSLGVLLLLALAYTLITIPLLRRTQKAHTWRDLIVPIAAGLMLGLLQIGLIDLLRYTLTGTWGGFHL